MSIVTQQTEAWAGKFGQEYTDRNAITPDGMELLYSNNYGITRTEMNLEFIGDLERSIRICEVGSNIGNQLINLQKLGFKSLYGIEIQEYAVELSKSRTKNINIIQGTAFDIPYKDGFFDLVFTSGFLIHIAPSDLESALNEIYRCTSKYIWGFEYFAEKYTGIEYRGNDHLLWKADFAQIYLHAFDNLRLVKESRFRYLNSENVDSMFLLVKTD